MTKLGTRFASVMVAASLVVAAFDAYGQPAPTPEPEPAPITPDDPPPLRWAGTTFSWSHALTPATIGIGRDPLSGADEWYVMRFALNPGVFLLHHPRHQLRVSTSLAISTLFMNSDVATNSPTSELLEVPIRLTYTALPLVFGKGAPPGGIAALRDPTLAGRGDHRTWLQVGTGLIIPSETDRARGTDLALDVAASLRQQVKILGSEAKGLGWLLLSASFAFRHDFIELPAWDRSTVASNSFREAFTLTLPIYGDLQIRSELQLGQTLLPPPQSPNCVVVTTGCVEPTPAKAPSTTRHDTGFAVELSYLFVPEFAMTIGYGTAAPALGLTGQRVNPFVNGSGTLRASLELSIDRLYQRVAGD